MSLSDLATRRSRYTLQAHKHALRSIRRDGPSCGAIPRAVPHQAFLEALALERIGDWDPAGWRPDILGFGITWVDPSPDCIAMGVPTRFLPDIAAVLMPTSSTAELSAPAHGREPQIWGLPGLRYRVAAKAVTLYVPGITARIQIPLAASDLWEKAVLIARAELDDNTVVFWDLAPDAWHPAERTFTQAWPRRYALGGAQYRASRLASDVLRRLPAMCKPYSAHDLWFNYFDDEGYHLEFEWQNSGPPRDVLDLLLHRKDGLDVHIDTQGRPAEFAFSDDCTYLRLPSASGGRLDLRHLRDSPRVLAALEADRATRSRDSTAEQRLDLERAYDYPSSAKFLDL